MTESEYIRFWKNVHALAILQEGQSITLDWLGERRRFIRARDEKGRFIGTQRDTVSGWVRRMEKDRNYKGYLKRVLKEIFILQLLSGRLGQYRNSTYAGRTIKRKNASGAFIDATEFASTFKVRKGSFDFTQQSNYNLYYSGESMEEFYASGTSTITEKGSSVEVRFSITPTFEERERASESDGRDLDVTERTWKLDDQSVLFFITNVLMPYVKQHQGVISDLEIKKEDDFTENEQSPIDLGIDEEFPF